MNNIELLEIFEEVGIYLTDDDYDLELDLDSIQFVSIIVKIEETYMLRISADYEDFSKLKSFNDFKEMIDLYKFDLDI